MKYLPNCESYLKVFFLIMNSFCQLLICFIRCYTLCGLVLFFFFPSLFSFSLLKTIRWSIPFYKQGNRDSWWMSQLAEGHVIGTECKSKVISVFYPLHFLLVLLERDCSKWGNGFQRKKPLYLLSLLSLARYRVVGSTDFIFSFPKVDMDVTAASYLTWYLIHYLKV